MTGIVCSSIGNKYFIYSQLCISLSGVLEGVTLCLTSVYFDTLSMDSLSSNLRRSQKKTSSMCVFLYRSHQQLHWWLLYFGAAQQSKTPFRQTSLIPSLDALQPSRAGANQMQRSWRTMMVVLRSGSMGLGQREGVRQLSASIEFGF